MYRETTTMRLRSKQAKKVQKIIERVVKLLICERYLKSEIKFKSLIHYVPCSEFDFLVSAPDYHPILHLVIARTLLSVG